MRGCLALTADGGGSIEPEVNEDADFFPYQLKIERETVAGREYQVECLEDLDTAIDQLFDHLTKGGNPALLEELCPYFGVIWASGRALAGYLAEAGSDRFEGRRLIEVGCGLALPSLVASKLGARVTATDSHPEVPRFLKRNVELNGVAGIDYRALNWRDAAAATSALEPFDWVVGSDILYERQQPALVAPVLDRLCAPGGTIVLADPGRPYLQEFADLMSARGFVGETRIRRERDGRTHSDIFLLVFQRG